MSYAPIIGPLGAPPKLRVELVPQTCWLSNVRSLMRQRSWKRLASELADAYDRRCETCKGRGRQHAVECHEVWLYDDERHVQELLRLQPLCPMCHRVKHLGRSINLGYEEQACAWLARVNGWSAETTAWYVDAVFRQWYERSQHQWVLDLSALGDVYDVPVEDLGLTSFVLQPSEREQMQHRRAVSAEDMYSRDGRRTR